jgi:hypothetical protein
MCRAVGYKRCVRIWAFNFMFQADTMANLMHDIAKIFHFFAPSQINHGGAFSAWVT